MVITNIQTIQPTAENFLSCKKKKTHWQKLKNIHYNQQQYQQCLVQQLWSWWPVYWYFPFKSNHRHNPTWSQPVSQGISLSTTRFHLGMTRTLKIRSPWNSRPYKRQVSSCIVVATKGIFYFLKSNEESLCKLSLSSLFFFTL